MRGDAFYLVTGALWFVAGVLACALWLTCTHEPEPRVSPLAAYRLALDAGLLHDADGEGVR